MMMPTSTTTTPTVAECLDASNWEYDQTGLPGDLRRFMAGGRQLSTFSSAQGISASVWLTPDNQVLVSYEGTRLGHVPAGAGAHPPIGPAQVREDAGIGSGAVTPGETAALTFARHVEAAAAKRGIGASNIFLTGHSLGGIQAEYAAQQTGLGGIAFEATGIPRTEAPKGDGRNFVTVVTYGDSIGNYASDIHAEQPFAPVYAPGGTGSLPHYGYVAMVGDPADQGWLLREATFSALGVAGTALTAVFFSVNMASYHLAGTQAHDLGVVLTQHPPGVDIGDVSGPVLPVAQDTIPQFIAADDAAFSATLPPAPGISPRSGPLSGAAADVLASLIGAPSGA
ncbi:MAG: lipase [Proteobacteria bacterium]|nr:lipase [Pseudomonadota bacterium]